MEESDCISCPVTNCFIKFCDPKWLEILGNEKQITHYKKDQYIVIEGNKVRGLFFIREGRAKVFSEGINGRKQVVRLTTKGDIIGHRGYGGDLYPISASVLEDSTVCFIDNDYIYEAFMHNPKLGFELMMYYSRELRSSEAKIKSIAQMNVKEKVIDALMYSKRLYTANQLGYYQIQLSRKDLADLAGINTQQLSRILTELKKEGFVGLSRSQVVIKKEDELQKIITPFKSQYSE